jgi:AcrR family transcriptional regulator
MKAVKAQPAAKTRVRKRPAAPTSARAAAAAQTPAPTAASDLFPGSRTEAGVASPTAEAIQAAALKLFARSGFDGTSLQEIAKAAGVRHPLIHYHFGTKEDLWCAVMDRLFGELKRNFLTLSEVTMDLTALQSLKLICRAFVQVTARSPERILIVRHELWANSPRISWLLENHVMPVHRFIDGVAERAIAEGSLKNIPAPHFSHLLIGAATSFFLARPFIQEVYGIDTRDPAAVSGHANWLIEAMFEGLTVRHTTPAAHQ